MLVANEHDPSEKILRCGDSLTVQPANGTHYRPIAKAGQPLPAAIRLDYGALLIEFIQALSKRIFKSDAARRGGCARYELGDGGQSGANLDAGPCRRSGGDQPSSEPVRHS